MRHNISTGSEGRRSLAATKYFGPDYLSALSYGATKGSHEPSAVDSAARGAWPCVEEEHIAERAAELERRMCALSERRERTRASYDRRSKTSGARQRFSRTNSIVGCVFIRSTAEDRIVAKAVTEGRR